MKITIAAIGKGRSGPERELFTSYAKRLPWKLSLKEIEIKSVPSNASRTRKEGELLLNAVTPCDRMIALDETGDAFSSEAFAALLQQWQNQGAHHVAFIIGGADGLDEMVRQRADAVVSLGRMTWPHLLVRPLLAEQLYRAHSILSGHPYHRGG